MSFICDFFLFIVFNATFSNLSAISWRPVLVVEETGIPREPPTMGKQLVNFITCAVSRVCPFYNLQSWALQLPNSLSHPGPYKCDISFLNYNATKTLMLLIPNKGPSLSWSYHMVVGLTTTHVVSDYHK